MAKKKYKKRQHSPTVAAKRQAQQEKLASEKDRVKKRWDPVGRALLYGDLVFLAVASLLYTGHLISDMVSGMCTILGLVLLAAALWRLFGNKNGGQFGG